MSAVSLATVLWFSAVVYGQVHESLSPAVRDPASWWIDLGVGEGVAFTVPFVAIVVANLWLLACLWRRRRA